MKSAGFVVLGLLVGCQGVSEEAAPSARFAAERARFADKPLESVSIGSTEPEARKRLGPSQEEGKTPDGNRYLQWDGHECDVRIVFQDGYAYRADKRCGHPRSEWMPGNLRTERKGSGPPDTTTESP